MLTFGYNRGLPESVKERGAAWGCRAIIHQNGGVDVVYNRQDAAGLDEEKAQLLDYLNTEVRGAWTERAAALLKDYEMRTTADAEFVLYDDGTVRILGNPQASHGYLYVCAFFTEGVEAAAA